MSITMLPWTCVSTTMTRTSSDQSLSKATLVVLYEKVFTVSHTGCVSPAENELANIVYNVRCLCSSYRRSWSAYSNAADGEILCKFCLETRSRRSTTLEHWLRKCFMRLKWNTVTVNIVAGTLFPAGKAFWFWANKQCGKLESALHVVEVKTESICCTDSRLNQCNLAQTQFCVMHFFLLLAAEELQFINYSKNHISIHCECMCVLACMCVCNVFVRVNKRGRGGQGSWRVSLWSVQVDSDPLCSWGPASLLHSPPMVAPPCSRLLFWGKIVKVTGLLPGDLRRKSSFFHGAQSSHLW